uniref:Uncharacterized protein n=1 Tax=Rhizophora mucronata TaxID=61149 RepID=A0A2P2QVR3_RHIMU
MQYFKWNLGQIRKFQIKISLQDIKPSSMLLLTFI